tara:strand:+ start:263 stop:454 length:192 start_codon:yes stop_codon:yes gene_type:complete
MKRNSKRDRQEKAAARAKVRGDITPQQQLAILDSRLGKGVGATRERARLAREIALSKKKGGKS